MDCRKGFKIVCLILVILVALCCCGTNEIPDATVLNEESQLVYMQDATAASAAVTNYSPALPDGFVLGGFAFSKEFLYYCAGRLASKSSDWYTEASIYKMNIVSGESSLITKVSSESEWFWLNEFACVGDMLFWVLSDFYTQQIIQYNMITGERIVFQEYSRETIPSICLTGDDRFLTWFLNDGNTITLYAYDTETSEIITLTDQAWPDSPYTRAYVNDGITVFLERAEGGGRLLASYDLASRKKDYLCLTSEEFMITRLQGNEEYVVCMDGYPGIESFLYLLERGNATFERINLENVDPYVFACHLYEDKLLINDNQANVVNLLDLKNKKFSSVEVDGVLILTGISPEGIFSGEKGIEIFTLNLKE